MTKINRKCHYIRQSEIKTHLLWQGHDGKCCDADEVVEAVFLPWGHPERGRQSPQTGGEQRSRRWVEELGGGTLPSDYQMVIQKVQTTWQSTHQNTADWGKDGGKLQTGAGSSVLTHPYVEIWVICSGFLTFTLLVSWEYSVNCLISHMHIAHTYISYSLKKKKLFLKSGVKHKWGY